MLGCSGDADPGLTPELAVGARERGTQDFDSWGFGLRTWEEGGGPGTEMGDCVQCGQAPDALETQMDV